MPSNALHRHIASRIRTLAEKRGVSLNKLADFAGVSRRQLGRILKCEVSPSVATLEKIAGALEVELRDLLPSAK